MFNRFKCVRNSFGNKAYHVYEGQIPAANQLWNFCRWHLCQKKIVNRAGNTQE